MVCVWRDVIRLALLVLAVGCSPQSEVVDEHAALSGLAETACRCSRSGRDVDDCWSDFRARTQHLEQSEAFGTPSVPVSTTTQCFNRGTDEHFCVALGHTLLGYGTELCSTSEVEAVERAYEDSIANSGDDARAAEAAAEVASVIARNNAPISE